MKPTWMIDDDDVRFTKDFVDGRREDVLVRHRVRKNVERKDIEVSMEHIWHFVVACLLSTQQKSGPHSPTTRFITTEPFPLSFEACSRSGDVKQMALNELKQWKGIRRYDQISSQIEANLRLLSDSATWPQVENAVLSLITADDPTLERRTAHLVDDVLVGFGPKQSRNLLQGLGVTKYEIPLDSRITKWLNKLWHPFKVSAQALADPGVYDFISDGVQELCRRVGAYPCVLDAAIFSSFDGNKWDNAKVFW